MFIWTLARVDKAIISTDIPTTPAGVVSNTSPTDNVPIIRHRLGKIALSGKKCEVVYHQRGKIFITSCGSCSGLGTNSRGISRRSLGIYRGLQTQIDGISTPFEPVKSPHLSPNAPLDYLFSNGTIHKRCTTTSTAGGQRIKVKKPPACSWAIPWEKCNVY